MDRSTAPPPLTIMIDSEPRRRRFGERSGMSRRPQRQSGLMPANLITLAHFSVSLAMNLSNSAGDIGKAVAPSSVIRSLILGSVSAALISLLSLPTISAGVFLGAPMPFHALAS